MSTAYYVICKGWGRKWSIAFSGPMCSWLRHCNPRDLRGHVKLGQDIKTVKSMATLGDLRQQSPYILANLDCLRMVWAGSPHTRSKRKILRIRRAFPSSDCTANHIMYRGSSLKSFEISIYHCRSWSASELGQRSSMTPTNPSGTFLVDGQNRAHPRSTASQ